jgi:hypothetical protein
MKIRTFFPLITIILYGCAGGPVTTSSSVDNFIIKQNQKVAVVPVKFGSDNDLRLPDAIETQLLSLGLNVVDRSALAQMVYEKGFNFTEIINGQEYFKIGKVIDVDLIIIVNSKYGSSGVADATMKIVNLANGKIVFSTNYYQPSSSNSSYIFFQNIMETAKELCKQIDVQ